MRFSTLATSLLSAAVSVKAADRLVKVGDGQELIFNPTSITIQNGDSVSFQFQGKNHSVTQSSFMNPCTKMANGTDSGFMFVPPNSTSLPQWTITINNASAPLWFFCAQTTPISHCEQGMVFAINPTPDQTFDAFQAAAKAATPPAGTNTTTTGGPNGTTTGTASGTSNNTGSSTDSTGPASTSAAAGGQPGGGGIGGASSTDSTTSPATTSNSPNGAMRLRGGAAGVLTTVALFVTFIL